MLTEMVTMSLTPIEKHNRVGPLCDSPFSRRIKKATAPLRGEGEGPTMDSVIT